MKNSQNIVCIGAANIDKQLYLKSELVNKSSNPVSSISVSGGVARNLAYNIGKLSNKKTILLTLLGNDKEADYILNEANKFIDLKHIKKSSPDSCVKCYTMFLPFLLIKIDVFS